ncbi:LysR family transcriptional regulator [Pseudonocardia yunnanensis]|uniref:LysR family transcriptional regulator n=1 Tax=Pseudonocardia yunnanensis TaxID=58107 RepID=A0ABW4ENL8_9PSEU
MRDGQVDLDLAQVRAFVAAADALNFSRAAAHLHLTQQALSKRVQRLEHALGGPLFSRGGRSVELTDAGRRFLPEARRLLVLAESAAATARNGNAHLRVDVWGQLHAPLRMVGRVLDADEGLEVEPSMRRGLAAATAALLRSEVDAAFGRVHDLGTPWPRSLRHALVHLDALGVLVRAEHPLAGTSLRPADLEGTTLWAPATRDAPEYSGYIRRFADSFGARVDATGTNLGIDRVIMQLGERTNMMTLVPADIPVPAGSGCRVVPLVDPVPRYPWSVVWRRDDADPALARFLRCLLAVGRADRRFDARRDWLPEIDRTPQP